DRIARASICKRPEHVLGRETAGSPVRRGRPRRGPSVAGRRSPVARRRVAPNLPARTELMAVLIEPAHVLRIEVCGVGIAELRADVRELEVRLVLESRQVDALHV